MKIDSPSHVPYLPLPAEIPALQQQESLDVDSQVNQSGVEQKNREIVAQQAGAHAHAQIQQNKFVDPSLTVQGKSQALLEQKPSVSKRGLKRSLANGFEQRDLSQGALSTAFQRAARDAQSQSGKPKGAPKHQEGVSPYSYEAQATISQQSLSSEARSPLSRSSVEAVMEAAQNALPSEIASTSSPASASPTDGVSLIQQELGGLEPSEAVGVESVVGDFSQEPTESVAKERPSIPRTLPGLESEQTLSRLSDRQLQQWVDGLGAFKDGASIAEKKPVFEQVAQQEGGRELGRLLEQLAGDNDYVSDQNVNTLGQSIASHATDDVKTITEPRSWSWRNSLHVGVVLRLSRFRLRPRWLCLRLGFRFRRRRCRRVPTSVCRSTTQRSTHWHRT